MISDSVGSLSPGRSSRFAMREVMLSTSMPVRLRLRRGPGGSGAAVRRALVRGERVLDTVAGRTFIMVVRCTITCTCGPAQTRPRRFGRVHAGAGAGASNGGEKPHEKT